MATLGLIGSGNIGGTLARLAVAAGLDVVLSNSRGPETLAELVAELGPRARAATPEEAAKAGDWVVVTVPLHAVDKLPAEALVGRTVLDTTNYYPGRDGQLARLDSGELTSSELVQEHLAGARVVKVFNNIYFGHLLSLARPKGDPDRSALPVAGGSAGKLEAAQLLDTLGYDTVDAGTLADSWRFQPDTPAYGLPYLDNPGETANFAADPGHHAPADVIRRTLAAATR
jgi:predicted dinucleotide-binding enzyme